MKHAFQRISQSLLETALITGVLVRVLHIVVNAHGHALDWSTFLGTFVLLPVVLLALATVHLANFPVKEWLWRAPVFGLVEPVVEAFFSLALILLGRERWGTARAELSDWPVMAGNILFVRFITVCIFALVLGFIVQAVRRREFSTPEGRHYHPHHPPGDGDAPHP